MKVICVGMPKTGTKSLCQALRLLGLNVYDYEEQVWFIGDQLQRALDEGVDKEEYRRMLEGVDATTDVPASFIWQQLADAFPEAKIIHMEREEEAWIKSFENQIAVGRNSFMIKILFLLSPTGARLQRLMNSSTRVGFGWIPSSPIRRTPVNWDITRTKYRQHNAHVRASVPADRLLVYKMGDGWAPLCHFLGLPVPDRPFPHRNKGGVIVDELLEDAHIFKRLKLEALVIIVVLVALLAILFVYLPAML